MSWNIDSGAPAFPTASLGLSEVTALTSAPWRKPDDLGRLPSEQFVGSARWRLARLFAALPAPAVALDEGPRTEAEAAWLLQYADSDIYNGGLHQFYSNSTGNFAGEYPKFAARVGASTKAACVGFANMLFSSIDLRDRDARNARLDQLDDSAANLIEEQTGSYYDANEPVDDLLVTYVEANVDTFLY